MARQAVMQATCTECGEHEFNHTVTDSNVNIEDDIVSYGTRCSCGAIGFVDLDEHGIAEHEKLSYERASWNQDDE